MSNYDVRKDDGFALLEPGWQRWVLEGDSECDCEENSSCSRCCNCACCQGIRLEDVMAEQASYPEAFK